ncbi:MAG: hypothetical protein IJ315_02580 [Firmicutes bacterium]|nr:hypothetical protein [Bacillota bacterium]
MKKANVIVLSGQSNAVGVGHVKCLAKHFSAEKIDQYRRGYNNVKMYYFSHDKKSDGFENVTLNQAELTKDTFGPEVGMAEYFSEVRPQEEVFIIKCAFGGKSLYRDFLSPSGGEEYVAGAYANPDMTGGANGDQVGWAYNELIKITHEGLELLKAQGYDPKIKAFCWMQGESDATYEEHTQKYAQRYGAMLDDFNTEFASYLEECIYVDAGISQRWTYWQEMNEVKAKFAADHGNCRYIDTIAAGLTTCYEPEEEPDTAHYDSDCTIRLGRMFAENI